MVNVANAIEESGNIFYCKFERVIEYTQKTLLVCKKIGMFIYTPARPPPFYIRMRDGASEPGNGVQIDIPARPDPFLPPPTN